MFWSNGGFVLYYKRLERGQFRVPQVATHANTIMVDATELAMLLDGIDVAAVKRPRRWEPPVSAVAAQAAVAENNFSIKSITCADACRKGIDTEIEA